MSEAQTESAGGQPTRNQFGTFGGVFTPSLLTILGVIMFMRTGYVTGQAGILSAVIILLIAKAITFLTGLSISAISTNTKVEGGGAYYLISRSLGPEFGGSIGVGLFLAQALSIPFYILGFAEALVTGVPELEPYFLWICVGVATVLFIINYIGASWAIKMQYFILAVLLGSVVLILVSAIIDFDMATFEENWHGEYRTSPDGEETDFWVIFAIFFPAVTGIMAGVNMSGDLKEPERSIPGGTLAAIVVGGVIYLLQIVLTGGSMSRDELINRPYESLLDSALFGLDFIIFAGVFAATLSSALGSFMGAPRILQALARDEIFTVLRPFSKGTEQGDEPRRGMILSFIMTLLVLFWAGGESGGGALNAVAAILTMFFLFTYGMTNMAAFIEKFSGNPSFRPRFRMFHWITALFGALGCVMACLLINFVAAVVAFVFILLIFFYVSRRVLSASFGDARRGFFYARVRYNLIKLLQHEPHPKNWRPTSLVLTGNPTHRLTLSTYAMWLGSDRGMVSLAEILVGDFHELIARRREALNRLQGYIDEHTFDGAFAEVLVAKDLDEGMASLLQAHSIGPIKPNLVMLGWSGNVERADSFARHLRLSQELGMSQVVLLDRGLPDRLEQPRIDLWWRGQDNSSLMLILAYLLSLAWRGYVPTIRILRMVSPQEDADTAQRQLESLAEASRLDVTCQVVRSSSIKDSLLMYSRDASVVLLGFRPPEEDKAEVWHENFTLLLDGLPTTLMVCSSGEADLFA